MPQNSELKIETGLSVRVEPVHPSPGHEPRLPAVIMFFGQSDDQPAFAAYLPLEQATEVAQMLGQAIIQLSKETA